MKFYSNGKLLITGEYAVLDGAKALALPTQFGQSLEIEPLDTINNLTTKNANGRLLWQSIDQYHKTWFQCEIRLPSLEAKCVQYESDTVIKIAKTLQQILEETQRLQPNFLASNRSFHVKTRLNFDKAWGLGTSSTLINNIAQWAGVDAFELQFKTFGGSGYDIACAQNDTPIHYQLKDKMSIVENVVFDPSFKDQLYFVYLNKKKNSRIAIDNYRKIKTDKTNLLDKITEITNNITQSQKIVDFEKLLLKHEQIISKMIQIKPIKQQLFKDYFGEIKSLGAWEGDFILATGNDDTPDYFKKKGYATVLPYKDIILF